MGSALRAGVGARVQSIAKRGLAYHSKLVRSTLARATRTVIDIACQDNQERR